jgi:organic radical activating enzyme
MNPVSVVDGRVLTETVEVNAVWHCNISCQSCSHGSPEMPRDRFADPAKVARDLRALSAWMRVEHVRVLGGEPLLHPDIEGLLAAIRTADISDTIRVVTNGLPLDRQTPQFWQAVDELHISVYPNTARRIDTYRELIAQRAAQAGTRVTYKFFDHFRLSFRPRDDDEELTQLIYATCQIGNQWRCLTLEDGTLYRCPQSALLAQDSESVRLRDGIRISDVRSTSELHAWLESPTALLSCSSCAGSAGLRHPHQMRRLAPTFSGPDLIDREYLERLLADPDADNGCFREESSEVT